MLTFNNHNLMLLTQFALKGKPLIGVVKVTELLNNELYAFDILIKAVLTSEQELIELARKISHENKIGLNLINAVGAYIYNIKDINSNDDFIHKSKYLLTNLAHHLYSTQMVGGSYRKAVKGFIATVENEDKTLSINLTRKFYRYWKAANRQVVESNKKEVLNQFDQKKTLIQLWDNVEAEFFSHLEICLVTQCTESLVDLGLEEKDIVLSSKFAKLITVGLRDEKATSDATYRDAINRTQILLKSDELKKLFLLVSREYYYLWIGNIPKMLRFM